MPLSLAAIDALLADNAAGDISEADMRSIMATLYGGGPFWMPATVGAYDDYFDEDNSTDWTAVAIAGTSEWNYRYDSRLGHNRGLLASFEDQAVGDWPAYLKSLSGITTGDYIQTAISLLRYTPGINMPLLVFTNGTTSGATMAAFGPELNSSGATALVTVEGTLADAQTFDLNQALVDGPLWAPAIHYRFEYDASNSFKCFWSLNGEDWIEIVTLASTLTPTHGGFVASSYGASFRQQGLFRYFHSNVTP